MKRADIAWLALCVVTGLGMGLCVSALIGGDPAPRDSRNTYVDKRPAEQTKSRAERAAEDFGLSDVRVEGAAGAWACSKDDSWMNSASVSGVTMAGKRVHATVCCGWLKGCTVRFR